MSVLGHFEGNTNLACGRATSAALMPSTVGSKLNKSGLKQRRGIDKRLFFNEVLIPFNKKGISGVRGSVKRHRPREGSRRDEGESV